MGEKALPLYKKVKEALAEDVKAGRYKPGEKIPTEPELEKIYGASRITIRRAVAELCQEGVLNKQQGSGTYVSEVLLHRCIVGGRICEGFTQTCIANGAKPGAKVIKCEIVPAGEAERKCLNLPNKSMLLYVQRIRTANDVPIYLENAYMSYDVFAGLMQEDLNNASLFRAMEKVAGRTPAAVTYRSLGVTRAASEQASALDIAVGEPMLLMKVLYSDAQNRPVLIGRQYYVGSRYVFESYDGIILDNIPADSL